MRLFLFAFLASFFIGCTVEADPTPDHCEVMNVTCAGLAEGDRCPLLDPVVPGAYGECFSSFCCAAK